MFIKKEMNLFFNESVNEELWKVGGKKAMQVYNIYIYMIDENEKRTNS